MVRPDFFQANTVTSLLQMSDYQLEDLGRITNPMVYDRPTDTFRPVEWADAFDRIGEIISVFSVNAMLNGTLLRPLLLGLAAR